MFFGNNLSLCHFAPTEALAAGPKCAYCGQTCKTIGRPDLDNTALELTMRRFKEGDASYNDTFDVIQDLARDALVATLKGIGSQLYEDYELRIKKSALQK